MRLHHLFAGLGVMAVIVFGAFGSSASETETLYARATFAGGCFWCMQPPFEGLDGVIVTATGYTGGHTDNRT